MYNKTIITFSFCDIQNNQGRDSIEQIVIFRKVMTCFNLKDMFRCCQHHRDEPVRQSDTYALGFMFVHTLYSLKYFVT